MQQKGMNMNKCFDYLALGLSVVDAVVPANKATFWKRDNWGTLFKDGPKFIQL